MATLTFNANYNANGISGWTSTIKINYTAHYDAAANATTVTFEVSSCEYSGKSGYGTTAKVDITVAASENAASTGSATLNTSGVTSNAAQAYTGTPSPASVTVLHTPASGKKSIIISASAEISVRPFEGSTRSYTFTGGGEQTLEVGNRGGTINLDNGDAWETYTLYIDTGSAWEQVAPYLDNGGAWEMLS